MATRIVRVDYCDICGKEGEVTSFRISETGGESRKVTLCDNPRHGAPFLRSLIEKAIKAQAKAGLARPRARAWTMAEIEAARTKGGPKSGR